MVTRQFGPYKLRCAAKIVLASMLAGCAYPALTTLAWADHDGECAATLNDVVQLQRRMGVNLATRRWVIAHIADRAAGRPSAPASTVHAMAIKADRDQLQLSDQYDTMQKRILSLRKEGTCPQDAQIAIRPFASCNGDGRSGSAAGSARGPLS